MKLNALVQHIFHVDVYHHCKGKEIIGGDSDSDDNGGGGSEKV